MIEYKFNKDLAGVPFVGINEYASVADNALIVYSNDSSNNGRYAYLTGWYCTDGDVTYLQTTINNVWLVNVGNTPDWKRTTNIKPKTYSQTQAQYLVNKIMRNNMLILQNNLLCARYAERFTAAEQQQIRELQKRLQARNSALQAEGLLTIKESNYPAGYGDFEPYLAKLMNGEKIGVATWVIIVIAATVIAGLGTAAYFAYKSIADESERDVKFSKELTRTLTEKLTPEEYEQLKQETKGIVTRARINQALGSYGNVIKIAALAFAGYTLYKTIKNNWL